MKKYFFLSLLVLLTFGCQSKLPEVPEVKAPVEKPVVSTSASPLNAPAKIEVSKLAGKSAADIDKIFGAPAEMKDVENGGKYRLYKTPEYPKGLAIRFYNGKAKSFNLILEKPFADSKSAIKENLGIDVGNGSPTKDPKETLTEVYRGTFGGVKYAKVSAKKQGGGSGFVFVFAETAN